MSIVIKETMPQDDAVGERKKVVVGLGNPILSDDGVGIFVAREVKEKLAAQSLGDFQVDVVEASLAGFNLLDLLLGYEQAIIVDSIKTDGGVIGEVYEIAPDDLAQTVRLASVHDLNFATALEFGKMMSMPMPEKIDIFVVEVGDNSTFCEGCCAEVTETIPQLTELVLDRLCD